MKEVIQTHRKRIQKSKIVETLGLDKGGCFILSAHREEDIDNKKNFISLMNTINIIAENYQIPVIYSLHPRSAKMIQKRDFQFHPLVRSMPPFTFSDYHKLMGSAFCVLSDSGTIPEEATLCGFPAVSIRTSTERPEALDMGSFVMGGIGQDSILQAIEIAVGMKQAHREPLDYVDDHISEKIIKIIQSYTRIIDEKIWRKT